MADKIQDAIVAHEVAKEVGTDVKNAQVMKEKSGPVKVDATPVHDDGSDAPDKGVPGGQSVIRQGSGENAKLVVVNADGEPIPGKKAKYNDHGGVEIE